MQSWRALVVSSGLAFSIPVQGVASSEISSFEKSVHITKIRLDPAGPDTGSKDHLNEEYIVIRNDSDRPVNVRGWTVEDLNEENLYRFPRKTILRPGYRAVLHTGPGNDRELVCIDNRCPYTYDNHWDQQDYVWDSDRDKATLRRANGTVVDECGYGRAAKRQKRCH